MICCLVLNTQPEWIYINILCMWHESIPYVKFRQQITDLLKNTLFTYFFLSKCYALRKNRLHHTVWIASKRKYNRETELIIPILFYNIYNSCPYTHTQNCQCYFTRTWSNTGVRIVQLVHITTGLHFFVSLHFSLLLFCWQEPN